MNMRRKILIGNIFIRPLRGQTPIDIPTLITDEIIDFNIRKGYLKEMDADDIIQNLVTSQAGKYNFAVVMIPEELNYKGCFLDINQVKDFTVLSPKKDGCLLDAVFWTYKGEKYIVYGIYNHIQGSFAQYNLTIKNINS